MFTVVVFLAHKISYSCSPLIKSLVDLDLEFDRRRAAANYHTFYPDDLDLESHRVEASFWPSLKRPAQLLNLIKRYHDAGNMFFVFAFAQIISLAYLGFKSIFQAIVIGHDKRKAKYYASSWFPRMFESYPDPENFYALAIIICTYYLLLRLLCLRRLVLGAIINKNGYKRLTITQTNMPVAGVYNMPAKAWFDLVKLTLSHKHLCNTNAEVRKLHLTFDPSCRDKLMRYSQKQLTYYTNAIDFNACFGELIKEMDVEHRSEWSSNWHISQSTCYVDPHELGILIMLQAVGFFALFSVTPVLMVLHLYYEISRLTPDPDTASYADVFKTIPSFLTSLNALIKFFDVTLNIFVQIPNQIEAAIIYWDLAVLISRTRKVGEALREDLSMCTTRPHEGDWRQTHEESDAHGTQWAIGADCEHDHHFTMGHAERKTLNESIEMHVRLAQMLNIEFIDLKRSHTLYLNLLFVGCGFCISVCISLIFVVKSNLMIFILASLVVSCSVPLVGVVLFCVVAELMVST